MVKLSKDLKKKIVREDRGHMFDPQTSPLTAYFVKTMRHCNAGTLVDASFWTKNHIAKGGKIFLTMSGAGSSFEQGIMISEMIRAGVIAGISVTGANLEESLYRLVAHSHYKYIPGYAELTPQEENELRVAGLRRITDTFLPEDASVKKILPTMEKLWRKAAKAGESYLWHEYFYQLFDHGIKFDKNANPDDCWLYQAYLHKIPLTVFGHEDSTMGNIFSSYCYPGDVALLKDNMPKPIPASVVKNQFAYMHAMAETYLAATAGDNNPGLAFWQLGGGIAADGPICIIPDLKHDYLHHYTTEQRDRIIKALAGFIEVNPAAMSLGSYSGAGWKEKITWDKLNTDSYGAIIQLDYTVALPIMTAIILGK